MVLLLVVVPIARVASCELRVINADPSLALDTRKSQDATNITLDLIVQKGTIYSL